MILKYIFKILVLFLLMSCSSKSTKITNEDEQANFISPESKFTEAMLMFDEGSYDEANAIFKNIERIYPLSNEGIQSQIMSGFIDYIKIDYDSAIFKFNKIIKKYPSLKNIDYVYYMKALCYYEQISHEGLDGKYNKLALENLQQVINRFPDSSYSKDSYQKIILVKSNIAAKHMVIGRFYQKNKKYSAALNRYKIVINDYEETKFISEALYRVSEIYYSLGMLDDAKKFTSILGYNYPNSEWFKLSYNNLTNKNEGNISQFFYKYFQ
jgi:outer membrane protein assembly factor BamD